MHATLVPETHDRTHFKTVRRGGDPSTVAPSFSGVPRRPRVLQEIRPFLGWPTDTVSVDFLGGPLGVSEIQRFPHTLLLFVPGNPGLVQWYTPLLEDLVKELGVGYAARGLSYAGHGLTQDVVNVERWDDAESETRDTRTPWTLDGQIRHKVAWMDHVRQEMNDLARKWLPDQSTSSRHRLPRFIFLSHSIGAFMVQRLCILHQRQILQNTSLIIHLMPFIRMDAPEPQRTMLKFAARNPNVMIGTARSIFRLARMLPETWLNACLRSSVQDERSRKVATALVRQPLFARNFFELGCEEIRDLPIVPDVSGLRLVAKYCDTVMLYCGGPDHWGPYHHVEDLEELKARRVIPSNISTTYIDELRHDFIVHPKMLRPVKEFCLEAIRNVTYKENTLLSRL